MSSLVEAECDRAPLYNLQPWNKSTSAKGPQCSESSDFCFFCSFCEPDNPENEGAALWDVVRELAESNKDLTVVVQTIYDIYRRFIRDTISWKKPSADAVTEVQSPEWTRASISRHLMFSNEFPQLFDGAIQNIFKSLIVLQNNSVIDTYTGEVSPEASRELLHTIDAYTKFRVGIDKSGRIKKKSKPRKKKSGAAAALGSTG